MNLILENTNQVRFFTNMAEVFSALRLNCADFDWYVSDIETNGFNIEEGWISGDDLSYLLGGSEIQFIWAVFSAFKKGSRFEVKEPPYVDGNPDYWNGIEPTPQLSGAEFEIACWDSSATILVGIDDQLAENYRLAFSDVRRLIDVAR